MFYSLVWVIFSQMKPIGRINIHYKSKIGLIMNNFLIFNVWPHGMRWRLLSLYNILHYITLQICDA